MAEWPGQDESQRRVTHPLGFRYSKGAVFDFVFFLFVALIQAGGQPLTR
jgi:hypothetical protein